MFPLPRLFLLLSTLLLLPLIEARRHYDQEPQCQTPRMSLPISDQTSAKIEDCLIALTSRMPTTKGDGVNPRDPDILPYGTISTWAQYGTCRVEIYDGTGKAPYLNRREVTDAAMAIIYSCSTPNGRVKGKKQLKPGPGNTQFISQVRIWPVVN